MGRQHAEKGVSSLKTQGFAWFLLRLEAFEGAAA